MLSYVKSIIISVALVSGSLVYGQYRATEALWNLSDEILLITVTHEEKPLLQSLTDCKSHVTAGIVKSYKTTRLSPELKQLIFLRMFDCENGNQKLMQNKQYIVFLSSENPGYVQASREEKKIVYPLSDLVLGIQLYNEPLEEFLLTKQKQ